jgi:hypothetical protein
MKETYSIYIGRLPSGKWKVGCDINYPNRPKQQKMKIYTCIETHDCVYMASDREIELQLKYFGKRDSNSSYHETVKRAARAWKKATGIPLLEEHKLKISKAKKGMNVGSKHGKSKLTEDDVLEIRAKYKPYVYTIKMLVEEYNVSKDCMIHIIYRTTWTHI